MPDSPLIEGRFARRRPQIGSGPNEGELLPFKHPEGEARMSLSDYFAANILEEIVASGRIQFHAFGDSGVGTKEQAEVADAISRDVDENNHASSPAFLLHLGDIVYGPDKLAGYANKFYRPNDGYPNLIFAIPGNHDGETKSSLDTESLQAYFENFCQPVGSQSLLAQQSGRTMPHQPGAYWRLTCPFIDIVGLYSNTGENYGTIAHVEIGDQQKRWLADTLGRIAAERQAGEKRALIIAVHHPPYASGLQETPQGHPGNPDMLADIDECCSGADVWPDAVLCAHAHSYQHYDRIINVNGSLRAIPFIVSGGGGISVQRIPVPIGTTVGEVTYKNAVSDHGYITVSVSDTKLTINSTIVVASHREAFETITVDLA